jgi:hypothetical protein
LIYEPYSITSKTSWLGYSISINQPVPSLKRINNGLY